jgi:uncharacterized protein YybS (DUF2232 family)
VKLSVVEGALLLASISIIVAIAVIAVPENNSVLMAAVGVPQVISSATAHALTRTSMTTTVANAEMSVLQTQVVVQELAFPTLKLITTEDMHRQRRKSALMSPSHAKMIYCHRAYT